MTALSPKRVAPSLAADAIPNRAALAAAKVQIFCEQQETGNAATEARLDQRLARLRIEVQHGRHRRGAGQIRAPARRRT